MALIKCPECGENISDQAEACIHCGFPVKKLADNNFGNSDTKLSVLDNQQEVQAIGETSLVAESEDNEQVAVSSKALGKNKKRGIFLGAILTLIIAAGVMLYIFYYRPHYVPVSVKDAEYSIFMGGRNITCSFTGTLLDNIPQGTGRYSFSSEGMEWSYEGTLNENKSFLTGTVINMPITISTYLDNFQTLYSGNITGGEMTDTLQVTDMPLRIEYDGTQYDGLYTGSVNQSLPNGNGVFKYEDRDLFFDYSGNWSNGALSGNGTLYSNDATVHFMDLDRTGIYNGEVIDGVFCGQGTFSATNDEGIHYTYEGEWANGLWNGQGKQVYDSDDYFNRIGYFKNGDFTPTVIEYFTSYGTAKNDSYTISDLAQSFIEKHENLFTTNSNTDIQSYVDTSFSYTQFSKNPSKYGDHLFKVTGLFIFQVFENDNYWGRDSTHFLAYDRNYNIYSGLLLNKSDKIVENKRITLYALPLDFSTYEGVDGNKHWALRFAAVYVE